MPSTRTGAFVYDAAGRLVRHREGGRNTVFCLDPRGNVTGVQWTDYPSGESFSETYSLSGDRLSGMTPPDGDPVPFYFDALGRMYFS